EEQYIEIAQAVKEKVDDSSQFIDWDKRADIKAQLKVQIILTLSKHGYPPATRDEVFKAIFEQAENFKKNSAAEDKSHVVWMYPKREEEDGEMLRAAEEREKYEK
ncbi:MAG: DUF3387 domain-containing protein, partial [Bacteroidales bacterium]|nr:DUF3387 domain-containing protein [Bacteroidales bacterium]